jgi:hypothetical protein
MMLNNKSFLRKAFAVKRDKMNTKLEEDGSRRHQFMEGFLAQFMQNGKE